MRDPKEVRSLGKSRALLSSNQCRPRRKRANDGGPLSAGLVGHGTARPGKARRLSKPPFPVRRAIRRHESDWEDGIHETKETQDGPSCGAPPYPLRGPERRRGSWTSKEWPGSAILHHHHDRRRGQRMASPRTELAEKGGDLGRRLEARQPYAHMLLSQDVRLLSLRLCNPHARPTEICTETFGP